MPRRLGGRPGPWLVRPLVQFGLAWVIAMAVLLTTLVVILDRTGTAQAISNAREITQLEAHDVVEPNLTDALLDGSSLARAQFDRLIRDRVLKDPLVRVKIWTEDGHVAFSDEPRLIGRKFTLETDQITAFATGAAVANRTDLDRPENQYESSERKHQLLEVYLRIRSLSGRTLLYENYVKYDEVLAAGLQIWLSFAPAILGTLLLMEVVQLSLAWSLSRRVLDGQREREHLLTRALDAADTERRRIAQDLHDGTVQDLTAVSLSLEVAARQLGREGNGTAASTLDEAARGTRRSVRQLRTLFVDIYPDDLHEQGLEVALRDLLDPFTVRGIATSLDMAPNVRLQAPTERLLFRVAREALRNVAAHAYADSVTVRVAIEGGRSGREPRCVVMEVADDGRGFEVSSVSASADGHLGLRLLADLVRDGGGSLQVSSAAGSGTTVRAELPL
jgi:two-component system, NarL family, sensor kinase